MTQRYNRKASSPPTRLSREWAPSRTGPGFSTLADSSMSSKAASPADADWGRSTDEGEVHSTFQDSAEIVLGDQLLQVHLVEELRIRTAQPISDQEFRNRPDAYTRRTDERSVSYRRC